MANISLDFWASLVGKFAGARALGSVGSTTIIITLTTGILLGMGGGVNAVTALHMGAEDYQRVHKTVHTSVILCFIAGLLLLVTGLAFSKPLLEVMNTKPELIDGATAYLMTEYMRCSRCMLIQKCLCACLDRKLMCIS